MKNQDNFNQTMVIKHTHYLLTYILFYILNKFIKNYILYIILLNIFLQQENIYLQSNNNFYHINHKMLDFYKLNNFLHHYFFHNENFMNLKRGMI